MFRVLLVIGLFFFINACHLIDGNSEEESPEKSVKDKEKASTFKEALKTELPLADHKTLVFGFFVNDCLNCDFMFEQFLKNKKEPKKILLLRNIREKEVSKIRNQLFIGKNVDRVIADQSLHEKGRNFCKGKGSYIVVYNREKDSLSCLNIKNLP